MIGAACCPVQLGAAVATTLFDELGPSGTVLLRTGVRRRDPGRDLAPARAARASGPLRDAVLLGIALAGMNLSFYAALDRIPLGIAVTLEFTGPFAVAVAGSRRASDLVWVALAAGGIVLLSPGVARLARRPGAWRSRCSRARFWAAYIVLAARSAGRSAAAGASPWRWSVATRGADPARRGRRRRRAARPGLLAVGLAVAVLSSAIPYSLELEALRRLPKGTFGVLMSLEPAVAALVGLVVLGQGLSADRGGRDRAGGRRRAPARSARRGRRRRSRPEIAARDAARAGAQRAALGSRGSCPRQLVTGRRG